MKREMDCIKFENRWEISDLIAVLEDCILSGAVSGSHKESIRELVKMLDIMYMEW